MTLQAKPSTIKNTNMVNAINEIKAEGATTMTIRIPKSLRSEFKIAVVRNDTDMTNVVIKLIKQYIQQ